VDFVGFVAKRISPDGGQKETPVFKGGGSTGVNVTRLGGAGLVKGSVLGRKNGTRKLLQ